MRALRWVSMSDHFDRSYDSPQIEADAEAKAETRDTPQDGPQGDTQPEGEQQPPAEPVQQPPEGDDGEPPLPSDVQGLRSAVTATRRKANDWKARAIAAEERLAAQERQQQQPKPQEQQQPAPQQAQDDEPDPILNPKEWREWDQRRFDERMFRERATDDLERLKESGVTDDQLEAADRWFTGLARENPALLQQLRSQRRPYSWAWKEFQKAEKLRPWADDPEAEFNRRLAAEREKWAAEAAANPAASAAPRANLPPPSLGAARNNAPPGKSGWSGDRPLSDIGTKGFA